MIASLFWPASGPGLPHFDADMNFTSHRIDLRSGFREYKSSVKPFKQCLVIWNLG